MVCFLTDENAQKKKEELEQLRNAEKKFQQLIVKRNELNDIARVLREERDMLNAKRKELREDMKKNKKERDDIVAKMRKHKELRNQYQQQAKDLISKKQKQRGNVIPSLPLKAEELKADIQMLEYRQETTPLTPQEENKLIESIRDKRKEYQQTLKQLEKQQSIQIDLTDTDQAITELFKKADEEHELVQKYYQESQKKHEEYMKQVQEISVSINESNKKHEQYIEVRNEAQNYHNKATDMKSKVLSIKQERRHRYKEAKSIIKEQNVKARNLTADKKKLDKHAEDSVDELKKGRKITLS